MFINTWCRNIILRFLITKIKENYFSQRCGVNTANTTAGRLTIVNITLNADVIRLMPGLHDA